MLDVYSDSDQDDAPVLLWLERDISVEEEIRLSADGRFKRLGRAAVLGCHQNGGARFSTFSILPRNESASETCFKL